MRKDFRVFKTPGSHKYRLYLSNSLVEPRLAAYAASSLQYLSGRTL